MKLLVIAAHPDDEVLGCGGTIARYANEGHEVFVAILGEGITSRFDENTHETEVLLEKLHEKARKVSALLGVKELFQYSFPDNMFDTVPLLQIVKQLEELIEKLKPQAIYTHHNGDLNIDHSVTFRAVMTATRPVVGASVKSLYTFEVPSSTEWSFSQFPEMFKPNVFVDITDTIDLKIKAMALYDSEMRQFPHPRSSDALRAVSKKWGSTAGLFSAEAFQLIRSII